MSSGVKAFAVATLEEGIRLRRAGIRGEILILGWTPPEQARLLVRWRLAQAVVSRTYAEALNHSAHKVKVHLAVDTGMHRLGLPWDDPDALAELFALPGLRVTGVFSHLCVSDSPAPADRAFTREQARRFAALVRDLPADCRPVMDYETFGDLSPSEVSAVAAAFLEETAALLGQSPMVYTGAYAAGARFAPETGAWPLWAADYGPDEPVVEANWAAWTGWQYSDQGQVPGVRGRVDLDLFTSGALLGEGEARPGGESFSYTVRRGDTLWGIARRYHTTVGDLARRNRVADPSLIYPGQVLQIPYTGTETAETYTVERGDTLWGIAREHGTTVEALAERNQLADPDLIYPGQVLRLPA